MKILRIFKTVLLNKIFVVSIGEKLGNIGQKTPTFHILYSSIFSVSLLPIACVQKKEHRSARNEFGSEIFS